MMKSRIVTRTARQTEEIRFTEKQDNSPSSQNSIYRWSDVIAASEPLSLPVTPNRQCARGGLDECFALLASTEIWAGLGERLSAIETKLCAPCKGRNQMQEFGLYLADASSSDKTSLRYNVSNFLNSATTRTLPLESASP